MPDLYRKIRVLALMESDTVTGPAKNLIQIGSYGRDVTDATSLDMTIATFGRGEWTPEPLLQGIAKAGLKGEILRERRRFDTAVATQIRTLVERYRPDVIQTHMVKSHFLLRWSGLWRSLPWLAFHHGYTRVDRKMLIYNQFDRWSLRAARQIVTVCKPFAEQITSLGIPADRIFVQHNSVPPFQPPDPAAVAALRSSLGIPEQVPVLLSVGRLSAEKGFDDLLEAAAVARRQTTIDFRLVIVGDGVERPHLEAAVARLGLSGTVLMPGHDHRMAPWYGMAYGLVMPSHSEGSPNVLLEAMAAGIPVVATSVGGIPEMVDAGKTALLVPAQNPQALGKAMAGILSDRAAAAALASAGHAAAGTRFSISSHYRSLVRVYEGLVPS
jgi:glycosyltransferase involved in cell wall biosynthesis